VSPNLERGHLPPWPHSRAAPADTGGGLVGHPLAGREETRKRQRHAGRRRGGDVGPFVRLSRSGSRSVDLRTVCPTGGYGALGGVIALLSRYLLGIGLPHHWAVCEQEIPVKKTATSLHTKIEQMLTEARVILPGVQALLGFQFVVMLTKAFDLVLRRHSRCW
jgi:hypothetical protein